MGSGYSMRFLPYLRQDEQNVGESNLRQLPQATRQSFHDGREAMTPREKILHSLKIATNMREELHNTVHIGYPEFKAICEVALRGLEYVNGVPEGWKLVPLEPTREMKEAAAVYREQCRTTGAQKTFGGYYRSMIAAAPNPPSD